MLKSHTLIDDHQYREIHYELRPALDPKCRPVDGLFNAWIALDNPAQLNSYTTDTVKEVILALNATVDGQTTAHYITELLADANVKVTRLAHGVPVGGELDYLDEGTLAAAIKQRTLF